MDLVKIFHLRGLKKKINLFLINRVFVGVKAFDIKRKLLNEIGYQIDTGTKVVGPIECYGKLKIGKHCWIGKNFTVNGNGSVVIGDNWDIGPEVTFQTGGHLIGDENRRAGVGLVFSQSVGNGVWIGGRSTVLNNTCIGNSSVIAGCACVTKDVEANVVVGGVPAKVIRRLDND